MNIASTLGNTMCRRLSEPIFDQNASGQDEQVLVFF